MMLSTIAAPPFPVPVRFQDVDPEILAVEDSGRGSPWQDFMASILPGIASPDLPIGPAVPMGADTSAETMARFLRARDGGRAIGWATAMHSSAAAIGDAEREAFWAAVIQHLSMTATRQ